MMHATAYLGTALLALTVFACGDDSGSDDTGNVSVGMTLGMGSGSASDSADDGGDDDGQVTSGSGTDDGVDTGATDDDSGLDTGDSESGGPPAGPACQHQCTTPADCFIDGEDLGLGCNGGTCSVACAQDAECIAALSGWELVDCGGDGDCSGGVCVDRGDGTGGCSLQPSQGSCAEAGLVETQATSINGGMVAVCGQPDAACVPLGAQNICIIGCVAEPASSCAGELTCEGDRLCHCAFDTQCVDTNTGNNCNNDGLCEFACVGAEDCPPGAFDGGMLVCQ